MKTVFLFPGQGAQKPGMGADLYLNNNIYKRAFDECQDGAELDLKKSCFDGERLGESEIVQPSIFAHSMGLLAVLKNEGFEADICAGLSLGEYSALTAAGAFGVGQCAGLVRKRGRIMDAAYESGVCGMLSVIGFDIEQVSAVIEEYGDVYIANHLSELQIVVAGYMKDLKELELEFTQKGAKMAAMLDVAGPFHTKLLEDAAQEFNEVLSAEHLNPPQKTVYSNALGEPYKKDSDIKLLLCDQMRSRVRWHDCTEHMIADGITDFIEIGPGNVLGKLIKRRVGKGNAKVVSIDSEKSLEKFLSGTEES